MARIARIALTGVAVLLVGFHGWVLAGQLAGGELAEPGVGLRWALAALVVAALAVTYRRGDGLFGRRTIAIWALAALLHGPAAAGPAETLAGAALPGASVLAVQVAAAASVTLGLLLYLLAILGRRSGHRPALAFSLSRHRGARRPHDDAWRDAFSPRPPPLA